MTRAHLQQALQTAIAGIQADSGSAKVVFRAETEWEDDVRCKAVVRNFAPMTIDEPPELGGGDAGPNPVELVLVALGTCQEIMYSAYAAVMGVPLDSVKCNLRGYLDLRGLFGLDPSIPAGYQKIVYETVLESSAAPDELRKLVQAVESHCPVMDTIQRPVEVSGKVVANGKPLELEAVA